MNKINIIGKNSKLSVLFLNYCQENNINIERKYSYKDIGNLEFKKNEIFILFSLSNKTEENKKILEILSDNKQTKFLVIGSTSSVSTRADYFRYSKLKKDQMLYVNNNSKNILCGLFGSFYSIGRKGKYYQSEVKNIYDAVMDLGDGFLGSKIYAELIVNKEKYIIEKSYKVLEKIFRAKLTAFIYKIFTKSIYGYSRVDYE